MFKINHCVSVTTIMYDVQYMYVHCTCTTYVFAIYKVLAIFIVYILLRKNERKNCEHFHLQQLIYICKRSHVMIGSSVYSFSDISLRLRRSV